MLRIRFLRVGKKNRPSFRLVVTPRRSAPKTGKFLELLGFYDPVKHTREFKKDRIQYWMSQGANTSDSVHNMLIAEGIIEGEKVVAHKRAKKKKDKAEKESGEDGKKEPVAEEEAQDVENKEEVAEEPKEEAKEEKVD